MTTYIKYKCSVCRRTKDIEQDNLHAAPNKCTITKGCTGFLVAFGQSSQQSPTISIDGLQDWYPRGQKHVPAAVTPVDGVIGAVTSTAGAFTIAVKTGPSVILPETLTLTFLQRRAAPIAFQDFTYKPTSNVSVFTGRDVSGRILRIDAAAISENRVQVRVNGVLDTGAVITTTTVTTSSVVAAGSGVNIRVQLEKDTIERDIIVTQNNLQTPSTTKGSWSNVKTVFTYNAGTWDAWCLYSCDELIGLGIGKMKITDFGTDRECMILLAHKPFGQRDRYQRFVVPGANVSGEDFTLSMESTSNTSFSVLASSVQELYPPVRVDASFSFIQLDDFQTTASSAILVDDSTALIKSDKIIGPT